MNHMTIIRSCPPGDRERGTSVLEFGSGVIVFFMLVFGIVDFGRAVYTYHFVNHAAQEATRYAIVRGSASGYPATATDISDYVDSIAPAGINSQQIMVSASWSPNNNPGSNVRVQVRDNFRFLTPMLAQYKITMEGTSQMVISQ